MAVLPRIKSSKFSFEKIFLDAIRERKDYQIALGEVIYLVSTNQIEKLKEKVLEYKKLLKYYNEKEL